MMAERNLYRISGLNCGLRNQKYHTTRTRDIRNKKNTSRLPQKEVGKSQSLKEQDAINFQVEWKTEKHTDQFTDLLLIVEKKTGRLYTGVSFYADCE